MTKSKIKTVISLAFLLLFSLLKANPTTLLDKESGFYKNASKEMIALYETKECKTLEIINYIPINAVCIIPIQRYKNGKAQVEYMGQVGWVDVSGNPDSIVLMHYEEMQLPTLSQCSQVGPYLLEIKSTQESKLVKLYTKASTKSKVIATLEDKESCLINLGCDWPWCRVDTGEKIGWILSINLTDEIQNVEGYCSAREIRFLLD